MHPSRRYRIESLIRESLASIVTVDDGLLTLRHISLNNDASVATVVYTVIGGRSDPAVVAERLNEGSSRYRHQLAKKINMRKTPKLIFIHDDEGLATDKMRRLLETFE